MKRRTATLLAAAILATSVALLPFPSPTSASTTDVCVVEGTATTTAPLTYPAFGPAVLAGFTFFFGIGQCLAKSSLSATGVVHGWCGLSTGHGATDNVAPHEFAWLDVGGVLVLAGGLTGVATVTPNPLAGENCIDGADGFLVGGAVALLP